MLQQCPQEVPQLRPDQQESIENLKSRISEDDVVVIDVRDPDQVESSGKIEAKRWLNIPLVEVEAALRMTSSEFEEKYKIPKPDQDHGREMLFHCGIGLRGSKALLLAHKLGYIKDDQKISPSQLKKKLENQETLVIDVRNPPEREENGYIQNSINIPFPDLDEALALSEEVFKTKYGVKKPSPNEGTVVFHCQHGGRGSRSIAKADNAGYKRTLTEDSPIGLPNKALPEDSMLKLQR